MQIAFDVPAVPVAQPRQRHRIAGKGEKQFVQNYTPTNAAVNSFKATVQMAARGVYSVGVHSGPVSLELLFVLPRPKNQFWKRKPMPRYPHTKKPDADNLAKAVKDALSKIIWHDDSQVWDMRVRKVVAAGDEPPHVEVSIELQ